MCLSIQSHCIFVVFHDLENPSNGFICVLGDCLESALKPRKVLRLASFCAWKQNKYLPHHSAWTNIKITVSLRVNSFLIYLSSYQMMCSLPFFLSIVNEITRCLKNILYDVHKNKWPSHKYTQHHLCGIVYMYVCMYVRLYYYS